MFDVDTVDFEPEHLTLREVQCLKQLAVGERPQRIAAILGIAPITVEFHIRNARRKLGAKTREHAIAIVVSRGLLSKAVPDEDGGSPTLPLKAVASI
ncbi:MAG: helix-turn-helix domain-containing protein [Roseibium sp.]|uniref:helix-turn-helix domain-containing protein n=1 Tax=Roseibium sp. TaxID=1936156 RepID=UPI003D9C126C